MIDMFKQLYVHKWRELYVHVTSATDTTQMEAALQGVSAHIMMSNLAAGVSRKWSEERGAS